MSSRKLVMHYNLHLLTKRSLIAIQPGIYRIINLATNTALETSAARVLSLPLSVSGAYSDSPTDLEYWRLTPGSIDGTFMFTSVVLLRKPTYYEGRKVCQLKAGCWNSHRFLLSLMFVFGRENPFILRFLTKKGRNCTSSGPIPPRKCPHIMLGFCLSNMR
jgi:hypothetical protein